MLLQFDELIIAQSNNVLQKINSYELIKIAYHSLLSLKPEGKLYIQQNEDWTLDG